MTRHDQVVRLVHKLHVLLHSLRSGSRSLERVLLLDVALLTVPTLWARLVCLRLAGVVHLHLEI